MMDTSEKVFTATLGTFLLWIFSVSFLVGARGMSAAVLCWPLVLWCPALFVALPNVFQPWSQEAKLRRRIRQAKRERALIQLRQEAEAEESKASAAFNSYIEGAA